MNVFIFDAQHQGLDFALRCQLAGHEVRLWLQPLKGGGECPVGKGLVDVVKEWMPSMHWADLVVITDNSVYHKELKPYMTGDYPVFGCNQECAELELNRESGQKALESCGIETLPYEVFKDYDSAIQYVVKNPTRYVSKPWGGASDKSITYVSKSPEDMIFRLQKWKKENKLKDAFMLMEVVEGCEMGVAGWFGSGGWSRHLEENWEFKRLMNDDLGPNTGEQGTVMRYVNNSKLFDKVLEPCTNMLHEMGYIGNIDMNCIIVGEQIWPLEFTCRLGWPAFHLQQALHEGDPAQWMLDLLNGQDTLEVSSNVGACVVLTHGDYPYGDQTKRDYSGYPLWGVVEDDNIHLCEVMTGKAPQLKDGKLTEVNMLVTAGEYVLVSTGLDTTVRMAVNLAYKPLEKVIGPSNVIYRTDIGKKLKRDLPLLQEHGFALDMKY